METLIYFYQAHHTPELKSFCVKEYRKKDYRLLRIGLSAEAVALLEKNELPADWNALSERSERYQATAPLSGKKKTSGMADKSADSKTFGRSKERRRHLFGGAIRKKVVSFFFPGKAEKERKQQIMHEKEALLLEIQRYWGEELLTYCICEPPVKYFNSWRFSEFRETTWIERLLWEADFPDFLVLGYSWNLREILFLHARRMKSLKICVTGRENMEELDILAEDLYAEYGLMSVVRVLTGKENYRNLEQIMQMKCNVLDFTQESRINPHLVPAGSIWFDVDASEAKRREFAERASDIVYKSLTVP